MKIPIDIKSGEIAVVKDSPKKAIIGIDLGTTNSLIAYINEEAKPIAIQDHSGQTIIPSIIHFDANGNIHVGNDAKPYLIEQPDRTIYSVKRLLGKSYKDIYTHQQLSYKVIDNDDDYALVKIQVGTQFYSPVELSSMILKSLKSMAEKYLECEVNQCVITVPAFFNDAQRQATRDAGKLAGLDVLRIINEPTAASLAYGMGLSRDEEKTIAVYDLGGGTFDLSILKIENGIFEVLATHGDTYLGGDDIDQAIVQHWSKRHQFDLSDVTVKTRLRLLAEQAKKLLSVHNHCSLPYDGVELSLDQETLIQLTQPLIDKTLDCCKKALTDAALTIAQIDAVVMVGGSTRSPHIKTKVSSFFGQAVHDQIDPDHVVALGAAIQADVLAGNRKDLLLIDVTPLSLGIETLGGLMDTIIPRNSKVPARAGRQYTTSVDGQKNLAITVYQGERDLVMYNRKLGSFTLKNIPPMPAGIPKIDIVFILDADGILTVKAKELRSETVTEVEIKSAYGISEEEMAIMLLSSISNASNDMKEKALIEAINEGNAIVLASQRFLQNNAAILTQEEAEGMQARVAVVSSAVGDKDKDRILEAIDVLNQYAEPLAHKSMDHTISQALKGEKI